MTKIRKCDAFQPSDVRWLLAKLQEEALELAESCENGQPAEVLSEFFDVVDSMLKHAATIGEGDAAHLHHHLFTAYNRHQDKLRARGLPRRSALAAIVGAIVDSRDDIPSGDYENKPYFE